MRQAYPFRIDENDKVYAKLKEMSRTAKDLYNQALWVVKEHYENTGHILSYYDLDKIMKKKENLEGSINYGLLPAKVSQQVLMLLGKNIKSFFYAIKDYKEHPEKYKASPRFPYFLAKDGYFVLIFTNQQAVIRENGTIQLTKSLEVSIPQREFEKYRHYFIEIKDKKIVPIFAQVRIVPKLNGSFFHVEILYDKQELNSDVDINRVASIDLGVNNLAAMVDSEMGKENRTPLLINGRPLKSVNQYYNKERAELQKELSLIDKTESKKLTQMTDFRNQKIQDYLHKASRFIIRYCLDHKIGHIIIGYNPEWKQSVNLGKRNNQNFVQIPFYNFIRIIDYKAQLAGIQVSIQQESYTSKCSALDLEKIAKHEDHVYAGKRIKRGLFASALGVIINADINGALNILRKAIGDNFLQPFIQKVARLIPSSGYLSYPLKVCL